MFSKSYKIITLKVKKQVLCDSKWLLLWRKLIPAVCFALKKQEVHWIWKILFHTNTSSRRPGNREKADCKSNPDLFSGHVQTCPFAKMEMCNLGENPILVIHWLHKLSLTFIVYAAALAVIITCFNSCFWLSESCSCLVFCFSCGWRRSSSAVSPSASPVDNGAAGVGSD